MKGVLAITGLSLVGIGCWQVYQPLAPLVVGALLLIAGIAGTLRGSN